MISGRSTRRTPQEDTPPRRLSAFSAQRSADPAGGVLSRFEAKIDRRGKCWLYTGSTQSAGYGQFWLRDHYILAHRFAWELANGEIPAGLLVTHSCDTRRCVRPEHLFLATNKANIRDAQRKGRLATGDRHGVRLHPECLNPIRGERHYKAKFTDRAIIAALKRPPFGRGRIARITRKLGCAYETARRLVTARTRKTVTLALLKK